MGFKSTDSLKSYRGFGGRTFSSGKGGDSGFPETKRPPVISSVGLTTTAGPNRFTSQDFTVTTTMLNDGPPISQKGVKATVSAVLENYPETDTIVSSTTSNPTISFSNQGSISGSWGDGYSESYTDEQGTQWFVTVNTPADSTIQTTRTSDGINFSNSSTSIGDGGSGKMWPTYAAGYLVTSGHQRKCFVSTTAGADWDVFYISNVGSYSQARPLYFNHNGEHRWAFAFETTNGSSNTITLCKDNANPKLGTQEIVVNSTNSKFQNGASNNGSMGLYTASSGSYYYTLNGGSTWSQSTQGSSTLPDCYYVNGAFYMCRSGGVIYRSTDLINWTSPTLPTVTNGFSSISAMFKHGDYVYLLSYNGNNARSSNNGVTWTTTGNIASTEVRSGGYCRQYIFGMSHSSTTMSRYRTIGQTLTSTLTSNANLGSTSGIEVGEQVRNGSNTYIVTAINTSTPSITVAASNLVTPSNGSTYTNLLSKGSSQQTTKYLSINSSGDVSDLVSSDPGFVDYGPGTQVTLSFPATFPTGNAPDVELPAGATIRAEIRAVNDAATDTELSNIVTPT